MFSVKNINKGLTFIKGTRCVSSYSLPSIQLLEELNVNKQDFKGLFSHQTYNQLWFERGENLVQSINELLIDNQVTPPNNLKELVSLTITKPQFNRIYNQSSLLYNLQFFLEGLQESPQPYEFKHLGAEELYKIPDIEEVQDNVPHDEDLHNWLVSSFGSITEFKTLLLNSANAIKGDGITWLVAQPTASELSLRNGFGGHFNDGQDARYSKLSIMNTYNAGTVDDSLRSGQLAKLVQQTNAKSAMNGEEEEVEENFEENIEEKIEEKIEETRLGSVEEAEWAQLYSDKKLIPLLAIDASMRNYLLDYGVFGKQQYLENVWKCINWNVVRQRMPPRFTANFSFE